VVQKRVRMDRGGRIAGAVGNSASGDTNDGVLMPLGWIGCTV